MIMMQYTAWVEVNRRNELPGAVLDPSQAIGFINTHGHVVGWLNDLASAPIPLSPIAPKDD